MTKLRFWDRILSAVMGVLCILAAAAIVLHVAGWLTLQQIRDVIASLTVGWQPWMYWGVFGVAMLLLVMLGMHGVGLLFRRRKDKGFVTQHTEYGDMNISIKALENMVKKCVDAHSELTANSTRIYLVRGGVSMDMKITLASGVNIPLTVNALQKQIKQYITSCSGVDVHEVRVKVETDTVKLLPPPSAPVIEPAPVEEIKRVESPAESAPKHKEEPAQFIQPVQETAETPVAEPVMEIPAEVVEEPAETEVCECTAEETVAEEEQPEAETVQVEESVNEEAGIDA